MTSQVLGLGLGLAGHGLGLGLGLVGHVLDSITELTRNCISNVTSVRTVSREYH